MTVYQHVKLSEAYKLIDHGSIVLVSTVSAEWKYNIAPIAWHCPIEYNPVTKVLITCNKEHKTYQNILYSKGFTLCIPSTQHLELVDLLGKTTGNEIDKMTLSFDHFPSIVHGNPVPTDCIAYIDLKITRVIEEETVGIMIGEVVAAQVLSNVWNGKGFIEDELKTLHHIGGTRIVTVSKI